MKFIPRGGGGLGQEAALEYLQECWQERLKLTAEANKIGAA
jgi:hypothetical protein